MPKDAPKEESGHEPAGATKDAFALSEDEFSEVVANAEQSDSDDDTQKSDLEADTDGGDTGKPDAKPDADADPDKTKDPTVEGFNLDDKPPGKPADDDKDKAFLTIIHNGQEIVLTEDRARELTQKGFDYDSKIGPHQKLAAQITADQKLGLLVDDYVHGRFEYDPKNPQGNVKPVEDPEDWKKKLKPLKDFEDPNEWQIHNQKVMREHDEQTNKKPELEQEQERDAPSAQEQILGNAEELGGFLKGLRPDTYDQIAPIIGKMAKKLSLDQFKQVTSSLPSLLKFYDHLAAQLPKSKAAPDSDLPLKDGDLDPQFSVKSGTGPHPRERKGSDDAWGLKDDAFDAVLNKHKGY